LLRALVGAGGEAVRVGGWVDLAREFGRVMRKA